MCYICGDLNLTSPKHQMRVINSLDNDELLHALARIKNQIKTLEKFPISDDAEDQRVTPKAASELRRLLLGLISEKLSRFQARRT